MLNINLAEKFQPALNFIFGEKRSKDEVFIAARNTKIGKTGKIIGKNITLISDNIDNRGQIKQPDQK